MSTIPEKRDRVDRNEFLRPCEQLMGMLVVMLLLVLAIVLRSL